MLFVDRILNQIKTTGDIKKLNEKDLKPLCKELRGFLLHHVSKTGGHLASNLGVVELTVALEYVFLLPEDKIVWDVGHQAYIHKVLTGRKNQFTTLRQLDGLSGFPKPEESSADAFAAGHSSTSISAAFGIAKARELQGKKNHVIAVIGDGSMTGGLAYEALNNAGKDKTNLIVILNDNQMSIDDNVGALSKHLNSLHTDNGYRNMKKSIKVFRDKVPTIGKGTYTVLKKIRDSAKLILLEGAVFEKFGFKYIGPIDGHNLEEMIELFTEIKTMEGPILIHIKTIKGKGYLPAEKNPGVFHGIGKFDLKTGETLGTNSGKSWSTVFGEAILEIGKKKKKVVGITAAMCSGTGFHDFQTAFPKRFFDVGIAEQHGTTFAAGMASQGFIPVFAVYSTFLQRAYDQLIHDVCMENLHVVFAIDRAGIVGADGETHQGVFDLSYLSHIPNMTVLSPKNSWELEAMLEYAINVATGPVAIRYPRGTASTKFQEAKAPIVYQEGEIIRQGEEIALLAEGHMLESVYAVAELLIADGYNPMVINMRFIAPLDYKLLNKVSTQCTRIFTIEDNIRKGGFGSGVLEYYSDAEIPVLLTNIAFPTHYIEQGEQKELFARYGMDTIGIYKKIKGKLGENYGK